MMGAHASRCQTLIIGKICIREKKKEEIREKKIGKKNYNYEKEESLER